MLITVADVKYYLDKHPILKGLTIQVKNKSGLAQVMLKGPGSKYEYHSIASFVMKQQLNCCGAAISSGTYYPGSKSEEGVKALLALQGDLAYNAGYSSLVMTVAEDDCKPVDPKLLRKLKWKRGFAFKNNNTGNTVAFWHKNI